MIAVGLECHYPDHVGRPGTHFMLWRFLFRLTGSVLSGSAVALLFIAVVQLVPDPADRPKHSPVHSVAREIEGSAKLAIQRELPMEPAGAAIQPVAFTDSIPESAIPPARDLRGENGEAEAVAVVAPDRSVQAERRHDPEQEATVSQAPPEAPRQERVAGIALTGVQGPTREGQPEPGPASAQDPRDVAPAVMATALAGEAHARAPAGQARRTGPVVRGSHAAHPHRGRIDVPEHRHSVRRAQHQMQD
jgi:hypothetical protein